MELKKIRTQKGLTQQAVADGIQCSPTVYARYERGEREPSIEMLLKLSSWQPEAPTTVQKRMH